MEYTLVLRNRIAEVSRLRDWLGQLKLHCRLSERDFFRIDLALNETVTNIIEYAYPQGGDHDILIRLSQTEQSTVIEITDDGLLFDPMEAPGKVLPACLAEAIPGGLGIQLIRHYCDHCRHQRSQEKNQLTMEFHRGPGEY